ncbi:hypothetical protein D3C71_1774340 [compost metagenome]
MRDQAGLPLIFQQQVAEQPERQRIPRPTAWTRQMGRLLADLHAAKLGAARAAQVRCAAQAILQLLPERRGNLGIGTQGKAVALAGGQGFVAEQLAFGSHTGFAVNGGFQRLLVFRGQ